MKDLIQLLTPLCPGLDEARIQEHLERLGPGYRDEFTTEQIGIHLRALARLSPRRPCEIIFSRGAASVNCTIIARDYPGEFSTIAGILAGAGFNIRSGEVYTYRRTATRAKRMLRGRLESAYREDSEHPRYIIDHFSGTMPPRVQARKWEATVRERMTATLALLAKGTPCSVAEARQQVTRWVTSRIKRLPDTGRRKFHPVEVRIRNDDPSRTRLEVAAHDSPAFLYSVGTALAMHGLSIETVRIQTLDGRVHDTIDFVDLSGHPVADDGRLDQIRVSVTVTKRFTLFLDEAPNPYLALSRLEQLIQNVSRTHDPARCLRMFEKPSSMRRLARMLGSPEYSAEDIEGLLK